MRKFKGILFLIIILLMIFTVKVYAEDVKVLIKEDEKSIVSGEKVVDVIFQADEDIRRNTI